MINLINNIIKKLNKPNNSLSSNDISFIKENIVNKSFIFEKISQKINDVAVTKINSIDSIPQIILFISKIYKKHLIISDPNISFINIIKFTLDTILESGVINIDPVFSEIIENMVDYSLELLIINIPEIKEEETVCCNRFFFWCK
jgi:hypothetical protein